MSWWQLLFSPVLLGALLRLAPGNLGILFFGWLPLTLVLQPLGTLLLRRGRYPRTGAASSGRP